MHKVDFLHSSTPQVGDCLHETTLLRVYSRRQHCQNQSPENRKKHLAAFEIHEHLHKKGFQLASTISL
jgi:hypothetical protein